MKKKARASKATDDMKSLIHSHADFFDHLIELIPAKFYQAKDEDSKTWYQGLSKTIKASLKKQSKQYRKDSRRKRFDPESNDSSSAPNQDSLVSVEEESDRCQQNQSVTYEELRQKLRRKIEGMRGNRGAVSDDKKFDDRNMRNSGKKRKRGDESAGGDAGKEVDSDDGEEIIEYGKVRLGDDEELKNRRKKKKGKLSKVKELDRAQRVQEVKRENSGVAKRESWKAATSRAMGVKVHDNSRLIKESIRREKKKKEKSSEKWKERKDAQDKVKAQRQQKRRDNIDGRIKDKKMRKIAKREKKLMRPGFEGRKDSYITQE